MRMKALIAAVGGLVIASSVAVAFQEQNVGGGAGAAPSAPAAKSDVAPAEAKPLPMAPTGTEIRIPGLGKLGVIPKMDFGLELLYGATESKRTIQEKTETEDQQLMIRGTLRHRF
jgi:hypothetical protein